LNAFASERATRGPTAFHCSSWTGGRAGPPTIPHPRLPLTNASSPARVIATTAATTHCHYHLHYLARTRLSPPPPLTSLAGVDDCCGPTSPTMPQKADGTLHVHALNACALANERLRLRRVCARFARPRCHMVASLLFLPTQRSMPSCPPVSLPLFRLPFSLRCRV